MSEEPAAQSQQEAAEPAASDEVVPIQPAYTAEELEVSLN